jgi:dipeptidyl aminopeptidase/acylaminoacyl peptidase
MSLDLSVHARRPRLLPARRRLTSVALLLAATPVFAQSPASTSPRPMTIVDLLNVPRLSEPQLSPDGKQVAFVRSDADWKANKRITHIWRVPIGGEPTQITTGAEGESNPRWSPDGASIVFAAKRAGDEAAQLYLLAMSGGEAVRLTTHDTAVSAPAWAPDGSAVYFLASDPKTAAEKAQDKAKDDIYAFDEDYKQTHLWKVAVGAKQETRLTDGGFTVASFRVSTDGRRIAHLRAPSPLSGEADRGEVWVMDATGAGGVQLTKNGVTESGPELSPEGSTVLFVSASNGRFETYYNDKLFLVPAAGGEARMLAPEFPYEVERAVWSKDGATIYFSANTGVRSQLYAVAVTGGAPKALTTGDHALPGWQYNAKADAHVIVRDQPANPGDVWLVSGGRAPTRVTRMLEPIAAQYALPKVEVITWKGKDGVGVEGLLYYPLGYTVGVRYPLVVQTHGGPAASDKFGFGAPSSYTQVLTAKGYAVLKPNYRGSTGYGDPFLRDMVGGYFRNAHLDVLAGVDHLVALGIADPDKLAKMGWSAGGHMTNKVITFTDRFKAASSGAGAANWVSMYAQSDVRTYRTPWFGGTPWQKDAPIDVYWDHSPLKYIANVKTPTIFLVGERDVRVPMPQSVEMYRALKSLGVPTRLYVAPREPHGFGELRHQLFKVNAELAWFEQWVTKRLYTWEKAPGDESEPKPATPQARQAMSFHRNRTGA